MDKFIIGCLKCGLITEKEDGFAKVDEDFDIRIIGEELVEITCKNCNNNIVSHYDK